MKLIVWSKLWMEPYCYVIRKPICDCVLLLQVRTQLEKHIAVRFGTVCLPHLSQPWIEHLLGHCYICAPREAVPTLRRSWISPRRQYSTQRTSGTCIWVWGFWHRMRSCSSTPNPLQDSCVPTPISTLSPPISRAPWLPWAISTWSRVLQARLDPIVAVLTLINP